MPAKNTEVVEQSSELESKFGRYEVDGDTLVANFSSGQRRILPLRMAPRKTSGIIKRATEMAGFAESDPLRALDTMEEFIPDELMDDEDLDYGEVLEFAMRWVQALGDRLGKALT